MPVWRTDGPRMDKCVKRLALSRSERPWIWCMWLTSGYVYYAWLNYRKFGSHYRKFGSFFRKYGSSVENVPAVYVETTQTFYNPSDCWEWLQRSALIGAPSCGRLERTWRQKTIKRIPRKFARQAKLPMEGIYESYLHYFYYFSSVCLFVCLFCLFVRWQIWQIWQMCVLIEISWRRQTDKLTTTEG